MGNLTADVRQELSSVSTFFTIIALEELEPYRHAYEPVTFTEDLQRTLYRYIDEDIVVERIIEGFESSYMNPTRFMKIAEGIQPDWSRKKFSTPTTDHIEMGILSGIAFCILEDYYDPKKLFPLAKKMLNTIAGYKK